MKRLISFTLMIFMVITMLSSCGSSKKDIVGQWYNSNGKCLDIRSDGSWKLEGSYGTGNWKYLDDKITVEFTDFYGDTQESKINESALGEYIDFGYYGDFYKDAYPSEEKVTSENSAEKISSEEQITEAETSNAVPSAISIDPFAGIQYVVSGISPYCRITINNQKCSDEVQMYVTYSFDKEKYANGETVTVTAELSANTGENSYILTSSEAQYEISNQPEFISSVDGVDLTLLEQELNDYILSQEGKISGTQYVFGHYSPFMITDVNSISSENTTYFTTLKKNKYDLDANMFNCMTWIYRVIYTDHWNDTYTVYINISAYNIVKYPDNSIKWGTQNLNDFDFVCKSSDKSLEDCVLTTIMINSDNYNISKVS